MASTGVPTTRSAPRRCGAPAMSGARRHRGTWPRPLGIRVAIWPTWPNGTNLSCLLVQEQHTVETDDTGLRRRMLDNRWTMRPAATDSWRTGRTPISRSTDQMPAYRTSTHTAWYARGSRKRGAGRGCIKWRRIKPGRSGLREAQPYRGYRGTVAGEPDSLGRTPRMILIAPCGGRAGPRWPGGCTAGHPASWCEADRARSSSARRTGTVAVANRPHRRICWSRPRCFDRRFGPTSRAAANAFRANSRRHLLRSRHGPCRPLPMR